MCPAYFFKSPILYFGVLKENIHMFLNLCTVAETEGNKWTGVLCSWNLRKCCLVLPFLQFTQKSVFWKQAKQTIAISLRKMNSNTALFRLEFYAPLCIYLCGGQITYSLNKQLLSEYCISYISSKAKEWLKLTLIVKILCARQSVYLPSFNLTTNQEVDNFGSIHQTKAVPLVKTKWLFSSKSGKSVQLWC